VIRAIITAPNPILRAGLREILHAADGISVTAETASLDELRRLAAGADVIVIALASAVPASLNQFLTDGEGNPAILALTDAPADLNTLRLAPIPAWGILSQDADAQEIIAALHALGEGLIVGSPRLLKPLTSHPAAGSLAQADPLAEPLTERERQVLQRIAQGLANKQIAAALGISEHTVKFHLSSIYAKLGATNRTEAVRLGTLQGVIVL